MTIGSGTYSTSVSTVIYDPQAPLVSGGSTPSKLVFLQPQGTGTGTVNAQVTPQPIVAVEDTNGNIVYSDASSVTLTSAGGHLASSCSGVENEGVITFGGCSFSATGSYTLTATDSNTHVTAATGATYSITAAPAAQIAFTTSPLSGVASSTANLGQITIQEQDAFGNPDPGALTVNLLSSSGSGVFALTAGGAPVTSVSIPTGQSSVSFYYGDTTAGSPTLSAAASGLKTGTQTETVTGGTPTHVVITPTPTSTGVSTTTSVKLALQLQDQFNNNTTSTGTTALTLSSSSAKGFFATTTGHTGTLGATATVNITNGNGTATEYYGDEAVGTPAITAKNGAATWGTTTLTMTVGAPANIAITSGPRSPQPSTPASRMHWWPRSRTPWGTSSRAQQ